LAVINVWAVVHEGLLKTNFGAEALIVAYRPWIAINFVHILWWDTNQAALFDDLRIFPYNRLYYLQIFHSNLNTGQQRV
jgi:hypothetical protein